MDWAILLMAYGGPDSLDDVEPYLLDVRGGRETPPELVEEIRDRYAKIGGRSPLLGITRMQAAALEEYLNRNTQVDRQSSGDRQYSGDRHQVFVGMCHWKPYISEAVEEIVEAGFEHLVALSMTPFTSRMSTGAYREKLTSALAGCGRAEIDLRLVESWHASPLFLRALVESVREELARFSDHEREQARVLFTAHSLPAALSAQGDPYASQFHQTALSVAQALNLPDARWRAGFQSAGANSARWLGPTLEEMLEAAAQEGCRVVLSAPIGFVADHVEVLYDIDIEARSLASELGIHLERTASHNASPLFIESLAGIVRQAIQEGG